MLTAKFQEAITLAADLHSDQVRKGTDIPYIGHLLSVAGLVLEFGGDESQAIAAVLHDLVEDQAHKLGGADKAYAEIDTRFGPEVTRIVASCTDAEGDGTGIKPPWKQRKVAYIEHIPHVDARAALVSICDKIHNARSISSDLRQVGLSVFDRFSADRDAVLWYYRALADSFAAHHPSAAATEFVHVVSELERQTTAALDTANRSG